MKQRERDFELKNHQDAQYKRWIRRKGPTADPPILDHHKHTIAAMHWPTTAAEKVTMQKSCLLLLRGRLTKLTMETLR